MSKMTNPIPSSNDGYQQPTARSRYEATKAFGQHHMQASSPSRRYAEIVECFRSYQ